MRTVGSGDQRQPLSGGDGARVEVFQIETLKPNFHENKGDEHVEKMRAAALRSLYFSPICTSLVKSAVEEHLKDREDLLKPQLTYPPLAALDIYAFFREWEWRAATFQQIRPVTSIPVLAPPPDCISRIESRTRAKPRNCRIDRTVIPRGFAHLGTICPISSWGKCTY